MFTSGHLTHVCKHNMSHLTFASRAARVCKQDTCVCKPKAHILSGVCKHKVARGYVSHIAFANARCESMFDPFDFFINHSSIVSFTHAINLNGVKTGCCFFIWRPRGAPVSGAPHPESMSGMDVDAKSNMSGIERASMLDAWRTRFEEMQFNFVYQDKKSSERGNESSSHNFKLLRKDTYDEIITFLTNVEASDGRRERQSNVHEQAKVCPSSFLPLRHSPRRNMFANT
jgi:hypothetical protein